jgi:FemAB-related protein (PEP-CTERM system-associated)
MISTTHTLSSTQVASVMPVRRAAVNIKSYTTTDATRWDEWVRRSPSATFCHLRGWARVIERTWRHQSYCLLAERAGELVGLLPLFHTRSRLFGAKLVSTPNAVYGGAVADDDAAQQSLIDAAQQLAIDLRVDYLELRDTGTTTVEPADESATEGLYVTFTHPLTNDEEALLQTFPRDLRRMIRQGAKHGLTAEIGRAEFLDDFYEVYATSVRNLGTPVFPKRLFAEFLREFPEACDILVVRQNGQVAGAVLSFYFRDTVLPYYGGAYPQFYRTGVNNFMYWELMRSAAARGFTRFDFGRSKRGTGAYDFKHGWRMSEHPLPYQYFLVRAKEMPNLNPLNPKFKPLIAAWKRLPLGVTKLVGPSLVKHLP